MKIIVSSFSLAACLFCISPASAIMHLESLIQINMFEYGLMEEIGGFRDVEWGSPKSIMGEIKKGEEEGFYKKKDEKLFIEETNFAIMAEEKIPLKTIEYGFEENRLFKVKVFFSGKTLYKKFVDKLRFIYGEPYAITYSQASWKLKKGTATIFYFPKSDGGYILIEKE